MIWHRIQLLKFADDASFKNIAAHFDCDSLQVDIAALFAAWSKDSDLAFNLKKFVYIYIYFKHKFNTTTFDQRHTQLGANSTLCYQVHTQWLYTICYRACLIKLTLLPLMYLFELQGIVLQSNPSRLPLINFVWLIISSSVLPIQYQQTNAPSSHYVSPLLFSQITITLECNAYHWSQLIICHH